MSLILLSCLCHIAEEAEEVGGGEGGGGGIRDNLSITQAEVTELVRKLLDGKAPAVNDIPLKYLQSSTSTLVVVDSASGVANCGGCSSF